MAQLAANAAEIAALKAEKEALSARVVKLEEELALARLHRFAPKIEKHVDRLFNEAEQVVDEDDGDREDGEVIDPVCHPPKAGRERSAAASLSQNTCRASASSMILPTTRRPVLAVTIKCIVWAKPSPNSSMSR